MKRNLRKEESLRKVVDKAKAGAARITRGLFVDKGHRDYNPDGELKWSECPTRTRAAIALTSAVMVAERAAGATVTNNVFPMVLVPSQLKSTQEGISEWEAMGRQVEAERQGAIEAVVVEPEKDDAA
ncbi:MAG TPA: hypothetical protein VEA41_03025 [Salinarimonas sp.]|nr:hypothetical protein [Salinarimonas sp.]